MSIKNLLNKAQDDLNKTLLTIKADANKLKSAAGAEADKLKGKLTKAATFYVDNTLYAPLLPLMPTMLILLKGKGVKLKDAKSIKDVAETFYKTFVNPANTLEADFETANFEYYTRYNLDLQGAGNTASDADTKTKGIQALGVAQQMADTTNKSELKDPTNQAGKTAGATAVMALNAAGIPVPAAVGSAVGGVVQGVIRGIINFFKNKKKEGNKAVIDALQQGGADADKIDVNTGEIATPQTDNKIMYIIGAVVLLGIVYYFVKKK